MSRQSRKKYWFHAKRHGIGWSLPSAWQGWLTLAGLLAGMIFASRLWKPLHPAQFTLATLVLLAAFLGICMAKGEPRGRRWH